MKDDLLYQIINKDNWTGAEVYDHYMWVIEHMPPRMRLVIELRIEGYTNKEIASTLNIAVSTVIWHIHRAKKRIFHASY